MLDAGRQWPGRIGAALGLTLTGQILQLAALAVTMLTITAVLRGKPLCLYQWCLHVEQSRLVFALVEICAGLGLIAAGGITLIGKLVTISLVRKYETYCALRVMTRFSEGYPNIDSSNSSSVATQEKSLVVAITKDVRYCGRALLELLLAMPSAVIAVTALAVLMGLYPAPSIAVVFVLSGFFPAYAWVNRRGANSMMDIERTARADTLARQIALQRLLRISVAPGSASSWVRRAVEQPHAAEHLRAYEARLQSPHISIFLGSVQLATVLVVVVVFFGARMLSGGGLDGGTAWKYVLALMYFLGSLRSLGKHGTNLVIFHSSFSRYLTLLHSMQPNQTKEKDAAFQEETPVELRIDRSPPGSIDRVPLLPGQLIAVISPLPLTRVSLADIVRSLFHGNPSLQRRVLNSAAIVGSQYPPTDGSLAESLGFVDSTESSEEPKEYPAESIEALRRELCETLPWNPAEPIDSKRWKQIDSRTRFLFAFLAALEKKPKWLFLEPEEFQAMEEERRERIVSLCRNCVILPVYDQPPDTLPDGMGRYFAVLSKERVEFLGRQCEYSRIRMPDGKS